LIRTQPAKQRRVLELRFGGGQARVGFRRVKGGVHLEADSAVRDLEFLEDARDAQSIGWRSWGEWT